MKRGGRRVKRDTVAGDWRDVGSEESWVWQHVRDAAERIEKLGIGGPAPQVWGAERPEQSRG